MTLYAPTGLALAYLEPGEYRIRRGKSARGLQWVCLYSGKNCVWDCNPEFFETWFRPVRMRSRTKPSRTKGAKR